MRTQFSLRDLIPPELAVETVTEEAGTISVTARATLPHKACPRCGGVSSRIHSRYGRTISDLPCSGRRVEVLITARRFFCTTPHCRQKIFAERFGEDVLPKSARRTARLECLVHHLGLALGADRRRALPGV